MRWSTHARGIALLLAMLALSACGRQDAAQSRLPIASPADIDRHTGRIEWQGSLACADCDGIDVRLVLEQLEGRRRYALDETYFSAQEIRFIEMGDWRRDGDRLLLHADNGARRSFGFDRAGRLQALDMRGEPLSDDPDDTLSPVAATSAL